MDCYYIHILYAINDFIAILYEHGHRELPYTVWWTKALGPVCSLFIRFRTVGELSLQLSSLLIETFS